MIRITVRTKYEYIIFVLYKINLPFSHPIVGIFNLPIKTLFGENPSSMQLFRHNTTQAVSFPVGQGSMAAAVEEEWESAVGKLALVSISMKVYWMFGHVPPL